MDRMNYRRLHDQLVATDSDAFKLYFEQVTKIGCNLYRCSMSVCYGDQTFEATGFGTIYVKAMEDASETLINKLQAQNLLSKSLVNIHQQQLESEKKKVYELNGQLTIAEDRIRSLEMKTVELENCEKILLDEVWNIISSSNLISMNGYFIQENGQSRKEKILKELKRLFKSSSEEKSQLQQVSCEKEKICVSKENEIRQLKTDLIKANEIIKKQHDHLKSASYKVSILGEVATKQDEVVETKDLKIKRLEGDLKLCLEKLKKRENEIDTCKEENKVLRSRWESSRDQIKTNENVITWLNKQLTELRLKVDENSKGDENRRTTVGGTNPSKEILPKGRVIVPELPRINLRGKIDQPENKTAFKPTSSRYRTV
ncbi:spindle assembly abnormal protein 6 homolog [Panonychus citri]|uniref:spindle assembly abnormal protein 6 homolog n=1 Tax=Panonychus citri TaxID=50023 RepID=UPI0023077155|nr:spindle assembly abnormal protein 6 homolog [Panonychus citri]